MVVYQVPLSKKNSFFENLSLTQTMIGLNVFLFLLFSSLIYFKIVPLGWIALNPINIIQNFYFWTFLTSMFMHGGIFHLFVNMLSLYFIGGLVEKILGRHRYLGFYLVAGLVAGLLFVLSPFIFPQDLNTFAVGASGALFGLVGILILLTPDLPVYMMFIPIPVKMKYAGPAMLILLWGISFGADIPIGNVAHLGGFVAGIVYGIYLKLKFPTKTKFIAKRFS